MGGGKRFLALKRLLVKRLLAALLLAKNVLIKQAGVRIGPPALMREKIELWRGIPANTGLQQHRIPEHAANDLDFGFVGFFVSLAIEAMDDEKTARLAIKLFDSF